jgi:hypothetical protein
MARQKVERLWNTREGQRSIVCGKDVISRLSDWTQQTYGVILNGERILKRMKYHEIDQEVKEVITAIERAQPFSP